MAKGYWQVAAATHRKLKGICPEGIVTFAEIDGAACGLGMPHLDTELIAVFNQNKVMTWWINADTEMAAALRGQAARFDTQTAR